MSPNNTIISAKRKKVLVFVPCVNAIVWTIIVRNNVDYCLPLYYHYLNEDVKLCGYLFRYLLHTFLCLHIQHFVLITQVWIIFYSCVFTCVITDMLVLTFSVLKGEGIGDLNYTAAFTEIPLVGEVFWWFYPTIAIGNPYNRPIILWLDGVTGVPPSLLANLGMFGPYDVNFDRRQNSWVKIFRSFSDDGINQGIGKY